MYRVMLLRCRPCVDLFRHDKEIAPTRSVGRKLVHFVLCAPRAPSNNLALALSICLLTFRSCPFLYRSPAQVWLDGDIMDATPFVAFLTGNTYGTKDDLLDAVHPGGHPAELLCFALSLRLNKDTRPTLKMFLRQLRSLRSVKRTAWWFGLAA